MDDKKTSPERVLTSREAMQGSVIPFALYPFYFTIRVRTLPLQTSATSFLGTPT